MRQKKGKLNLRQVRLVCHNARRGEGLDCRGTLADPELNQRDLTWRNSNISYNKLLNVPRRQRISPRTRHRWSAFSRFVIVGATRARPRSSVQGTLPTPF